MSLACLGWTRERFPGFSLPDRTYESILLPSTSWRKHYSTPPLFYDKNQTSSKKSDRLGYRTDTGHDPTIALLLKSFC